MKKLFNEKWLYRKNGEGSFEEVTLPHDAMIDSPRSADAASGGAGAYFEGGVYEYEKRFDVPADWNGKNVYFVFGGIMRCAKVFVNGQQAGEQAYGYTEFCVSADPFLRYGSENVIRIVADNSKQPSSRWYTGGGIYRSVWLAVKDRVHFAHRGISVETVSINPATVRIRSERTGGIPVYAVSRGGKIVATRKGDGDLEIPDAKLWDDVDPNLYTLTAKLYEGDSLKDEETLSFGIRELSWNKDGFFVNGRNVLFRGGCVHHDNGILGARAYEEAEDRKVRKLKEAGFNAVRSSHNPCSEAFLDACDRYGVYLVDELSDMWYMHKKKYDYACDFETWHERDLAAMVRKDRSHPSVIMYSLGNEVSEPCEQKGLDLVRGMRDFLHGLDPSRPVTAGVNYYIIVNAKKGKGVYQEESGGEEGKEEKGKETKKTKEKPTSSVLFNMIAQQVGPSMNKMGNSREADEIVSPFVDLLDIAGYNYASGRYPLEGEQHPGRLIYGSETYPQDIYKNWQQVKKYPYLLGDFVWSAWDYLGETGIGGWSYEPIYGFEFEKPYPWVIGDVGEIDLIGVKGIPAEYAAVVWGLRSEPCIGVRPLNHGKAKVVKSVWRGTNALESWSWKGCEKATAEIEVYTDAPKVALYLNGKKIGCAKTAEDRACFKTKYQPGVLKAVALSADGKEVASSELVSASGALAVSAEPEKDSVRAGEVFFTDVSVRGANGIVESNADEELSASVENGEILAFGSAEQKQSVPYSAPRCRTYYGRALLCVRAGAEGEAKIRVRGKDGKECVAVVSVSK